MTITRETPFRSSQLDHDFHISFRLTPTSYRFFFLLLKKHPRELSVSCFVGHFYHYEESQELLASRGSLTFSSLCWPLMVLTRFSMEFFCLILGWPRHQGGREIDGKTTLLLVSPSLLRIRTLLYSETIKNVYLETLRTIIKDFQPRLFMKGYYCKLTRF